MEQASRCGWSAPIWTSPNARWRRNCCSESEERFRLIANSAPVPMWVSKLDRTRSFANQAYLDFLGLAYTKRIVFDWREILHPDDQARIVNESVAGEASLKPFVLEARYRRADGAWRWMRSESQPRWDPAGKHIGFIGVAHDITAAKEAEGELRRLNETLEQRIRERTAQLESSEAQLRAMFETSNLYQGLLDLEGNVIYANKTALAGIVAAAADVVGKPFWDTPWFSATPAVREAVANAFAAVRRGESMRTEMLLHLPIGDRYFDFAMRPVFDQHGSVTAVLPEAVDITERRQAEEALRQSQKMEAVGQLTGGVAHDFNNLLTIIRSATDFLRRRDLPDERRRRYIDAISDTVDRASKLTGQLLAFARRQPLAPQVFDVGQQVEGDRATDPPARRRKNPDRYRDPRPRLFCDGRYRAIRDLPDQPCRQQPRCHGRRRAHFDQCRKGECDSRLSGTSETARRKIHRDFGRGYRHRHPAGQAHLHLRAVLHDQGGWQGHRPRPQPGARIRQAVRRRNRRRTAAWGKARHSPSSCPRRRRLPSHAGINAGNLEAAINGRGHRILVVEDNEDVGRFSTELLQDLGYATRWADNAKQALALIAADQSAFDLVFSDVIMPGMNGVELAAIIRERHPHLPVVLTSGYSSVLAENAHRGFELIQKPYSVEALSRALRRAISERSSTGS